ncbi:SIMPL domain-containing protein [uncultured Cyclobacterium sp.]|uniref:SIMPL domain-containing protein n=1 Tax=uncultured Cyclobacterium sp. TaxID=453820 RepID=UPI0030EC629E|tara:strand:+ start:75893 stop:76600 length:708 start_codon:yes stop_codon:yes gene_type:complete
MKKLLAIVCLFIGFQVMSMAQETSKISVDGKSEIKVSPDEALVRVSLTTKAMKTADATEGLNRKAAEVTNALKKSGVKNYELKADNYFVNINRVYTKGTSRDSGYVASQTLRVLVKDTGEDLVKVIEALHSNVDMGFQLELQLSENKKKEYETELLQLAIKDAKNKAELIANSLDLEKITVHQVFYGEAPGTYQPKMYRSEAMMINADNQRTAPTIQPDEQTLSDQVKVIFTFDK